MLTLFFSCSSTNSIEEITRQKIGKKKLTDESAEDADEAAFVGEDAAAEPKPVVVVPWGETSITLLKSQWYLLRGQTQFSCWGI